MNTMENRRNFLLIGVVYIALMVIFSVTGILTMASGQKSGHYASPLSALR
jgi:hypothetical protein